MGSAQSARRIQPGGARPAVPAVPGGSFPLPVPPDPSTRPRGPLLPGPLPPRPPSGASGWGCGRGGVWRRAGGAGGGVGGGPPPGRRPAAAGRTSTAAVRRDRLRDGWEGPGGEGGPGVPRPGPRPSRRAGPAGPGPPGVTAPPRQQRSPNPGAEGARTRRRALPPAPPRASPPRGREVARAAEGGATLPRGGRAAPPTARPLSHPRPSVARRGGCRGRGGLSPVRPGRSRAVGPGGPSEPRRLRSARSVGGASARGRRRRRPPTRPVLKHGPRSLTRARVRGSRESRRGAMKVKRVGGARRGPPRLRASPPHPEVGSRGLSSPPRAHHRPVSPAAPGRWSTSARVGTRKMVNYAWAGRSQRKLWWRSVAVLTCKSVVRPGYRGERLIEPSSSWFPPKFPSG